MVVPLETAEIRVTSRGVICQESIRFGGLLTAKVIGILHDTPVKIGSILHFTKDRWATMERHTQRINQ